MTKNTDPAGLSSSPKPLSTQYRVIADRSKGDDPTWDDLVPGDRYLAQVTGAGDYDHIVRIERPVPTTDEPQQDGPLVRGLAQSRRGETVDLGSFAEYAEQPSLPTREQIAELRERVIDAIIEVRDKYPRDPRDADSEEVGDAVLALIQNGADR